MYQAIFINFIHEYISKFILFMPIFISAQNQVCFGIERNPNPNHPAFSVFSKYINVLGCIHIYAEPNISDEKILHVASVAAEILDNNEDGVIDDSLIESSLIELITIMPIFQSENGNAIDIFFDNFDDQPCRWNRTLSLEILEVSFTFR